MASRRAHEEAHPISIQNQSQQQHQSLSHNPLNAVVQHIVQQLDQEVGKLHLGLASVVEQLNQLKHQLGLQPAAPPPRNTGVILPRPYQEESLDDMLGFLEIIERHLRQHTAQKLEMERFPNEVREELLYHRGLIVSTRTRQAFQRYDQYMSEYNRQSHHTTLPDCPHEHSPALPDPAGNPNRRGGITAGSASS